MEIILTNLQKSIENYNLKNSLATKKTQNQTKSPQQTKKTPNKLMKAMPLKILIISLRTEVSVEIRCLVPTHAS